MPVQFGSGEGLDEYTSTVEVKPYRATAGMTADCTVRERHTDRVTITDHPVDTGAAISDHMFKEPAELELVYRFSSATNPSLRNADPTYEGDQIASQSEMKSIYQFFLNLQTNRTIFDVYTGKRNYKNMVLKQVVTMSDAEHENVLELQIDCREILLARTKVVKFPPAKKQKNPQKTNGKTEKGQKSPVPAKGYKAGKAGL